MAEKPKPVNLALQGGGAHGAFTWGVLDRILEHGRLAIAGVSGTSAGAMNAVALVDGYTRAGAGRRAQSPRQRLADHERGFQIKPHAPYAIRCSYWLLGARSQPVLSRDGLALPGRIALSVQSYQHQSAARPA